MPRPSRARKAPPVFGNMVSSDQAYGSGDEEYGDDVQLNDEDDDDGSVHGEEDDDDEEEYGEEQDSEMDHGAVSGFESGSEDDDQKPARPKSRAKTSATVNPKDQSMRNVVQKSTTGKLNPKGKVEPAPIAKKLNGKKIELKSATESKSKKSLVPDPDEEDEDDGMDADGDGDEADKTETESDDGIQDGVEDAASDKKTKPVKGKKQNNKPETGPDKSGKASDKRRKQVTSPSHSIANGEESDSANGDIEEDAKTKEDSDVSEADDKPKPRPKSAPKAIVKPVATVNKAIKPMVKPISSSNTKSAISSKGQSAPEVKAKPSKNKIALAPASKPATVPPPKTGGAAPKKGKFTGLKPKASEDAVATASKSDTKPLSNSKKDPEPLKKVPIPLKPGKATKVVVNAEGMNPAGAKAKEERKSAGEEEDALAEVGEDKEQEPPEATEEAETEASDAEKKPVARPAGAPSKLATAGKKRTREPVDKVIVELNTRYGRKGCGPSMTKAGATNAVRQTDPEPSETEEELEVAPPSPKRRKPAKTKEIKVMPQHLSLDDIPKAEDDGQEDMEVEIGNSAPVSRWESSSSAFWKDPAIDSGSDEALTYAQRGVVLKASQVALSGERDNPPSHADEANLSPAATIVEADEEIKLDGTTSTRDIGGEPSYTQSTCTSNEVKESIETKSRGAQQLTNHAMTDAGGSQAEVNRNGTGPEYVNESVKASQESAGPEKDTGQKKRKRHNTTPCPSPSKKKAAPAPAQKIPPSVRRDIIDLFLTPEYLKALSFTSIETDNCKSPKISRHWRQVLGPDLKHYFSGDTSSGSPKKGKTSSIAGGITKEMRCKIWEVVSKGYDRADWQKVEKDSGITTTKLKRHLRDVMIKEAKSFIEG
ncbi:hypothetical protein IAU59_003363 [Kwoniella sp. CBS 9459]